MNAHLQRPTQLSGSLRIPPDKAICHRAALLSALAQGKTKLSPWPSAEDCQRTLGVIKALGVSAVIDKDTVIIDSPGVSGLKPPSGPIDCGESGTTFRLAAGLLAGLPFRSTLTASPSLSRRPMRRIVDPLSQMGASIAGRSESENPREVYPPLTIEGRPLKTIRYDMPVASAQVKSAILLAGLFAEGPTTVIEKHPTRDHTERAFQAFSLPVTNKDNAITITPGILRSPGSLLIPGDISSAAFFLVAGACVPNASITLTEVGLNPTRAAVIAVLRRMGALIDVKTEENSWEMRGTITVRSSALTAVTIAPSEVPGIIDELPVLMVAAACARGTSRFAGVAELRVKETDRIQSMVSGLGSLGARVRVLSPDTVEIEGQAGLSGCEVDSAGDHRTAMSLAVAGLLASGKTIVRGAECVAKSFPDFFELLGSLAGSTTVKTIDKP